MMLHEPPLGTIVHGVYLLCVTPLPLRETSTSLNFWYLVHSHSLRQQ